MALMFGEGKERGKAGEAAKIPMNTCQKEKNGVFDIREFDMNMIA